MNKLILMGRLTRDPEIKYAKDNLAIARYSLAVDRKYKRDNEPTADFFNCVTFGKSAEFAEKYLHKGIKIVVTGHVQTGSYTNKDNAKIPTFDVVVDEVEFADSKGKTDNSSTSPSDGDGMMCIPEGMENELPF